jgi:mono/diheme cytochrome c family protein
MRDRNTTCKSKCRFLWPLCVLLVAGGCGARDVRFRLNQVYLAKQENAAQIDLTEEQRQDIEEILAFLWGSPDEPRLPELDDALVAAVLNPDQLRAAAGPVASDQQGRSQGLYREHCAHCHGISGDGVGPTAVFLDPYPRDFRRGIFKFKSTASPLTPPTHADLVRGIRNGNPGTAMPSFRLLSDDELDALVHYVKYLSIRGEVERILIFESIDRLEDEYDRLVDMSLRERNPDRFDEQMAPIRSLVSDIVRRWAEAPDNVTPVPAKPAGWDLAESLRKGRQLYLGNIANCAKCHGQTGLGDGQETDYDDWAKEIVDPQRPETSEPYLALGALHPRRIHPRNFHRGIFRGGSRPEDLYLRIHNGIAGTPMPAAPMRPEEAEPDDRRLRPEDVWYLVDYVVSLAREPHDSLAHVARAETEGLR